VRLYGKGLDADRPLDAITAAFLRDDLKGIARERRGAVARLAQAMWRRRRLLDALTAAGVLRFGRDAVGLCGLALEDDAELAHVLGVRGVPPELLDLLQAVVGRAPLEVRASLPPWLCERLVQLGGEALALSTTKAAPHTLRANTLKGIRDDVIAALRAEDVACEASARSSTGIRLLAPADLFRTKAFHAGLFEVQDEGSQLIAELCAAQAGEKVTDGCAGAGGKTLALAAAMQNKGSITALDVHGGRLTALQERARRAGAHNVRAVSLEDDPKIVKRLRGVCDLVLVDAPCSGTGVLRRNPDTSWRLVDDDVRRLVTLQRELLERYAPLVKPGGRLVYATCSLLPEENDDAVAAFVAAHPDFVVDTRLHLRPDRDGTDGFFAARLNRR